MWFTMMLCLALYWVFYKYWISIYHYWEKRGIPFCPGSFPFGSHPNLVILKEYRGFTYEKMYKEFTQPAFGIYILRQPMLVVRDPETIQLILTKEFSHFRDRHIFHLSANDVLSQNLFNFDGEKWKGLRMKLTTAFSSGKMKAMFPLFVACAESFSSLLLTKLDSKVDIKELTSRYTADVICSCAFGMEMDVINNPDNKLREIGMRTVQYTFLSKLKLALTRIFPENPAFFPIRYNTNAVDENYLIKLVNNVIEQREKSGIKRNDIMDVLIQLKNKKGIGGDVNFELEEPFEITLEIIAAQCFMFFVAGFESASSAQTFFLYELALHQDIQSRVIEEINSQIEKYNGITYEALQEMKYLDMVISETMRKYPTLPILIRYCTKSFTTPSGHAIEKGTNVMVPVWALHHDPQYFPNPDKFDPERFSQENRKSIVPYTYMPFGEGPRMCIGVRFGLLQTKMGILTFLRKFRVEPCSETKIPLTIGGNAATTTPKDPIILKLVARTLI